MRGERRALQIEYNLSSEILISSDPWENRVAILEDGDLAELYIEREERVIGSIYKGKVQNVLPGMGAAQTRRRRSRADRQGAAWAQGRPEFD
jgi:hypothetical protein